MEKYTLRNPANGVSAGFLKGFTCPVRLDQRAEFVGAAGQFQQRSPTGLAALVTTLGGEDLRQLAGQVTSSDARIILPLRNRWLCHIM
jgi:hypothetical protein